MEKLLGHAITDISAPFTLKNQCARKKEKNNDEKEGEQFHIDYWAGRNERSSRVFALVYN